MILFGIDFDIWKAQFLCVFPIFFSVFINYRLLRKKNYNGLLVALLAQSLLIFIFVFSIAFSKSHPSFEILADSAFFIIFFWFLFCFLEASVYFVSFDWLFEFYISLGCFFILVLLSFSNFGVTFDLEFSILGLFVFSILRVLYFYVKSLYKTEIQQCKLAGFLNRWTYIWTCTLVNLVFGVVLLYFWDFDYSIILGLLQFFGLSAIVRYLFASFLFPYGIFICDYLVNAFFARIFSPVSGYSSRVRTFKSFITWLIRGVFSLLYFSIFFVSLSGFSWNLSILVAISSLGFKGVLDDFINGICVLVEDSVNIGEFIHIAGISGTVEDVSLRVVTLRSFDGSLYVVPFRKVEIIKNRSKEFIFIVFDILVDLSVEYSRVIDWISKSFAMFRSAEESSSFISNVLDDLEIVGITSITAAGVIYQARLKTAPFNTRFIKAVFFECLKELSKKDHIRFGFQYAILTESKK